MYSADVPAILSARKTYSFSTGIEYLPLSLLLPFLSFGSRKPVSFFFASRLSSFSSYSLSLSLFFFPSSPKGSSFVLFFASPVLAHPYVSYMASFFFYLFPLRFFHFSASNCLSPSIFFCSARMYTFLHLSIPFSLLTQVADFFLSLKKMLICDGKIIFDINLYFFIGNIVFELNV